MKSGRILRYCGYSRSKYNIRLSARITASDTYIWGITIYSSTLRGEMKRGERVEALGKRKGKKGKGKGGRGGGGVEGKE
jgi:hypothetical protein